MPASFAADKLAPALEAALLEASAARYKHKQGNNLAGAKHI
jgi:hypothetical protein